MSFAAASSTCSPRGLAWLRHDHSWGVGLWRTSKRSRDGRGSVWRTSRKRQLLGATIPTNRLFRLGHVPRARHLHSIFASTWPILKTAMVNLWAISKVLSEGPRDFDAQPSKTRQGIHGRRRLVFRISRRKSGTNFNRGWNIAIRTALVATTSDRGSVVEKRNGGRSEGQSDLLVTISSTFFSRADSHSPSTVINLR